jgi:twitching motility protein PilT
MQPSHGGLFGKIAVHMKFIDQTQLRKAVEICGQHGGTRRMGDVLVDLGWMNVVQVNRVLEFQKQYELKQQSQMRHSISPMAAAAPGGPLEATREAAAIVGQSLREEASRTGQVKKIDHLLGAAARFGASDLHVHVGHPAVMRLHGRLVETKTDPYTTRAAEDDLLEILTVEQRSRFLERGDLGFAYEIPGKLRARITYCRQQRGGIDGVFRLIPLAIPEIKALELPGEIARFTTFHQGLILFTGPAGCGKSTTMAGLVNVINSEREEHIITIEDPIEYVYPSLRCLVRQRQVLDHTKGFEVALRAALREDPDIIIVGELRDRESIALAITAAETGHLVFGTLHTSSAIRTINRILDVFPPQQAPQIRSMVSESLRGIVSQRLVPTADGKRRVPAVEVLTVTPAVSNLIRDGKTFQIRSAMQVGRSSGMRLLDDSLAEWVERGVIANKDALEHAEKRERFS